MGFSLDNASRKCGKPKNTPYTSLYGFGVKCTNRTTFPGQPSGSNMDMDANLQAELDEIRENVNRRVVEKVMQGMTTGIDLPY
jgi:hypothetical protein